MSRANESAYPSHGSMGEVVQTGLTIRAYFAAMAMQGIMANTELSNNDVGTFREIATMAVKQGDALIAELAKVEP